MDYIEIDPNEPGPAHICCFHNIGTTAENCCYCTNGEYHERAVCGAVSPHGTKCSLKPHNGNGNHYDREAECVWYDDGLHMHDGHRVGPT